MKMLKRNPLSEKIYAGLLKAYQHIPAELEAERKRKEALALAEKLAVKVH
jgi:hypothetical protein